MREEPQSTLRPQRAEIIGAPLRPLRSRRGTSRPGHGGGFFSARCACTAVRAIGLPLRSGKSEMGKMAALIFSGASALFCGVLVLLSPRAIVKLGEVVNRVILVDNFPILHHRLIGAVLLTLSLLLFLVGLAAVKS